MSQKRISIIAALTACALAACSSTTRTEWETVTKDDGTGPKVVKSESHTTTTKEAGPAVGSSSSSTSTTTSTTR